MRGAKQAATPKHRQLCRWVNRMCRRDQRASAESIAEEAETAAANSKLCMLYEKTRILTSGHTTSCVPVRDRNKKFENCFSIGNAKSSKQDDIIAFSRQMDRDGFRDLDSEDIDDILLANEFT